MLPASGVYAITDRNNGKCYIGSAMNMDTRSRVHLHRLRKGTHHSVKLQRAFNKRGEAAFQFRTLLVCAPEHRIMFEQRAIEAFDAVRSGYNVLPTAGSSLGVKRSTAQRERLSILMRGNANSAGHRHTDEARAKMSAAQKERMQQEAATPEYRARLKAQGKGNKSNLGRTLSLETRVKMSAAHKARFAAKAGA